MTKFYSQEADGSMASNAGPRKSPAEWPAFQTARNRAAIDGWPLP
jgi:hypothetical protein